MRQQRRSIGATRTQQVKTFSKSTHKKIPKFDPVAKMIDTTRHRLIEENEKNESRSMWSGLIMSLSCEL